VKKRAAFFGLADTIRRVYAGERWERVAELTDLRPSVVMGDGVTASASGGDLADVEVAFSTWGMPRLNSTQLDALPRLQAVFYAAGSVQSFARPFLERGIAVFSAWQSNAVPVAEFTLAQILLATKGYFRNERECRTYESRMSHPYRGHGNYGETVALLGAGAIGRLVIGLLKPFHLNVIVFDPFLSEEDAAALGVEKVTLEAAFSRGYIVSNHLANKPETVKMLNAPLFALLRDSATFINTGRGATVDEDALIAEFTRRPTLTALLDVTWPEPPVADSPLYALPNIHLTSHIAGSIGDEVRRMADDMIAEFVRWERGEPTTSRVTLAMLDHLA
jgi:phosphoglycerate dehydrogenase-like enzyme